MSLVGVQLLLTILGAALLACGAEMVALIVLLFGHAKPREGIIPGVVRVRPGGLVADVVDTRTGEVVLANAPELVARALAAELRPERRAPVTIIHRGAQ